MQKYQWRPCDGVAGQHAILDAAAMDVSKVHGALAVVCARKRYSMGDKRAKGKSAVSCLSLRLAGLAGRRCAVAGGGDAAKHRSGRAQRLMAVLVAAYPDFLGHYEGNDIVWKDGTRMAFDDGRGAKDFETLLAQPDLADMFYAPYPLGRAGTPAFNSDPGRAPSLDVRQDGRLHQGRRGAPPRGCGVAAVAGVGRGSKPRTNGVAERLQAVSNELGQTAGGDDQVPRAFSRHLQLPVVAGTNRISAHGHGIAIDIATTHADYWFWNRADADGRYAHKNRIPWEIVEVFEKHGFVWGGKWYHYDTMHFEYRLEIIAASKQPPTPSPSHSRMKKPMPLGHWPAWHAY